jgi:hypothetical protein
MNELSVADGFRFGCGFMLAAAIAWIVLAILSGILAAIFGGSLIGLMDRFAAVFPTAIALL